jgi:DNA-binding IclR family transcriptional regulator
MSAAAGRNRKLPAGRRHINSPARRRRTLDRQPQQPARVERRGDRGPPEELARRTGCAVRTGVLLLGDVIVVHHEPRPDGTRQMPEVGIVIPAHACALGKALLAFDRDGLDKLTPRSMTGETITDPAQLRDQLAVVRRTGIATEHEEAVLGECGIAAPLTDAEGEVAGAIGLVVPATEWPLDAPALDALRMTARAISRELGAPSWPPTAPDALLPPASA